MLVRKNGHTVFTGGYGVADLHTLKKIDARTNFRLASFSKQFTAMAIMLLVHDSKLTYDRTLADIFPGFPVYGRAITVRHLLTHTSGLAGLPLSKFMTRMCSRCWRRKPAESSRPALVGRTAIPVTWSWG